jgi:hypothetical protein
MQNTEKGVQAQSFFPPSSSFQQFKAAMIDNISSQKVTAGDINLVHIGL